MGGGGGGRQMHSAGRLLEGLILGEPYLGQLGSIVPLWCPATTGSGPIHPHGFPCTPRVADRSGAVADCQSAVTTGAMCRPQNQPKVVSPLRTNILLAQGVAASAHCLVCKTR